ncbi:MAG: glucokinase [Thermodesulfobacteriota bacterium]
MQRKEPRIILAGDIGGTKTRLGLFRVTDDRCHLRYEETFLSKNYPNLEAILKDFLKDEKRIGAACFGIPGPVIDDRVTVTNLPWHLDRKSLQKAFSFEKVTLINDLVANAYGIALLHKNEFRTLNSGKKMKGNAALISAGTGLGEAILFWNGKRYAPFPSEGGHSEFAPRNRLEMELLEYLISIFNHVSYEHILTGEGLFRIYKFLRDVKGHGQEPEWLSERMTREDPPHVISETARKKANRLCVATLDLFTAIYGAAAGNLALQVMALGGVYVGGGIAPRIIWKLKEGSFMRAFKDKGRLSDVVARIPVKVIMNEGAAFLGAASYAVDLLRESRMNSVSSCEFKASSEKPNLRT